MSAIPETSPPRSVGWPALVAFALMAAFVTWRVLSLGFADHFAADDPAAALRLRPSHPEALLVAAEAGEGSEGEDLARRAIAAAPLEGAAYRLLAEAAGDSDRALTLYTIAARLSPRDRSSRAWLFDHHLARGDIPVALSHLDALLRIEPTMVAPAAPILVALAQAPQAREHFARSLATAPPWRSAVLRRLPAAATDLDAMVPFYDDLISAGALPTRDFEPWLKRLGDEGRWGDAYLDWVALLPADRRDRLGNVVDGGFELPPDQGGFGWRFGRLAGARIERRTAPGSGSKALRIAFEHRRAPFAHVRQLLALPPGTWRLSGQVRLENLRSERGLVWTVNCAGPGVGRLAETAPFRGQGDWREFSAEFRVPEECAGQWLLLKLPARIPAEQRIGGQVWFDDLRITRIQ